MTITFRITHQHLLRSIWYSDGSGARSYGGLGIDGLPSDYRIESINVVDAEHVEITMTDDPDTTTSAVALLELLDHEHRWRNGQRSGGDARLATTDDRDEATAHADVWHHHPGAPADNVPLHIHADWPTKENQ